MFGHQNDQPAEQDSNAAADEPNQPAQATGADEAVDTPADQSADQPADTPADAASDSASKPADDEPAADDSEEVIIKPGPDDQSADEPSADQAKDQSEPADEPKDQPVEPESKAGDDWQHPGTPLTAEQISDVISPAGGFPKRPSFEYPTSLGGSSGKADEPSDAGSPADEELLKIRKQAVDELAPLIEKLDLPPEDKFRTIMMMVQVSDNESLVKAAYDAAHAIEDEKVRAQALLDVVNEVNYFTQPSSGSDESNG